MRDSILTPLEIYKINKQLKKQNKYNQLVELNENSPYYPFYNFINELTVPKVYPIHELYDARLLLFMKYIRETNDTKYNIKEIKKLYSNQQDDVLQEIMDRNDFYKIPVEKKVRMIK